MPTVSRSWDYEDSHPARRALRHHPAAWRGVALAHSTDGRLIPAQASQHAQSHPHDPEQEAADALQARYRTFVSAQSSLTVPTEISLASLQILFDEREQLRQQSFTRRSRPSCLPRIG